jgi:hypothetical protein
MRSLEEIPDEIEDWCRGRSPWARAPLVLYLAYVGIRHLADAEYTSLFGALNLGIHEGGHLLFSWQPSEFLMVAGGTLLQLAAPILSAVMFARQPDFFAVTFCSGWLGMNLYNVATYAADAQAMALPLVTVGDGSCLDNCHDWNYLLGETGLLAHDQGVGTCFRVLAFLALWGGVAAGAWLVARMARGDRR